MSKPLRVSWSAIRSWEECSMKSYLQREGKRAKVTNIRNFWPGIIVDQWMRQYLDNMLARDTPPADWVSLVMDEQEVLERDRGNHIRYRDAADRDAVRVFCTELINRLIPLLTERVLPYPYEHGKWFKVPFKLDGREVLLTGEMDLLVDHPEGQVVWDLKGTADDQYYRKVVAQLTFYDIAVWASTGRKTHYAGLIQPMCKEPLMAWQITDEARRNLLTRISRYAHDVWAGEKTCTTDKNTCHFCDVKHACSRFSTDAFGSLAEGLRTAAGDIA